MKKIFIALPATLTLTTLMIFSGHMFSARKNDAYQLTITTDLQNKNYLKKEPTKEELATLRTDADIKFRAIEILIVGLKTRSEIHKESTEPAIIKKISCLEEQLRFERARLDAFEKNPVNWESFKTGFTSEMAEIGKTAESLSVNFGKDFNNAGNITQSGTYISKLSERK